MKNKAIKLLIIIIALILIVVVVYKILIAPVGESEEEIKIEIPLGTGSSEIAEILKENKVIKSKNGFKLYIKLHKINDFQAGTYYLKNSITMKELTNALKEGKVYNENQIMITYLEGKNMSWFAKKIEDVTNNKEEDVYNLLNNKTYINSLIEKYWFITDEIKDEDIYYTLEGYLFPDTYAFENKDVTIEEIFEKMLDQMELVLNEYKAKITKSKYSIHELLTIASIVEMEGMDKEDRASVASVIYNRLNEEMAIQSDVTTYYAFQVDMGERDLYQYEIDKYNKYNTRGPNMEGELPIGPISSISKSSIEATVNPNSTDYLYFVADKNGKLYFSETNGEHESTIRMLKEQGLWYEYE